MTHSLGEAWNVRNDLERDNLVNFIDEERKGKRLLVTVRDASKRSLNQNDMKEQQVAVIAEQLYGGDEDYARREAKYLCGVPILYRDDPKFKMVCDKALSNLTHEERIEAMEFMPVTSLMSKSQMKEYIDKVFDKYASRVVWGDLVEGR